MTTADWIALGLLFLTALGLGGSILCFLMRIAERLGTMAASLKRIELDLTNNQAEHHELYAAVGEHREQLGKHDVRLTTLEEATRTGSRHPDGG
jgi:hypothetical protein